MRFFPEQWIASGRTQLFSDNIIKLGGKHRTTFDGYIVPDNSVDIIKALEIKIQTDAVGKDGKPKKITVIHKLSDMCSVEKMTDPHPGHTIQRVGRNYIGTNIDDYIVVSMPNATFLTMQEQIDNAKDIQIIGNLPAQNTDGSYPYWDGLLNIIPKDPPTAEEEAAKLAAETKKAEREKLISAIRAADESALATDEKVSMLFKKTQMELK